MIKIISIEMIDRVMDIYKSAIRRMDELNILQWDDLYPDRDIIIHDVESGTIYGYYKDDDLCAIAVINNIQSNEYSKINWKYKDNTPLVLHRLCVAPKHQNKGIAREMILFAENFAEDNNYKTIRFDAFINNPVSVNLYKKLGYVSSGIVHFRKGDFYCFEKNTIHYQNEH